MSTIKNLINITHCPLPNFLSQRQFGLK